MTGRGPDRLARAVAAWRAAAPRGVVVPPEDHAARFDAVERDVQEVRSRVNALFFAVITAGVADLVARTVLR